jgi:hypothetical protein
VPAAAIVARRRREGHAKDGRPWRFASDGAAQGDHVEILSGLRAGDAVVAQPGSSWRGQTVKVEQ